ncbi:hypothetical protein EYF80_020281 [Liparis tanakae]|uniref:Uncharacterized protein n=1 Tax=Liparis tanakae TaxID=230148 RepID=A0A4Z2HUS7_9TELE|nr:hypothetical protein EYF80_020281 [Liparis tanakae]
MLSAISVGVTVPCLVSVCRISSMDSSFPAHRALSQSGGGLLDVVDGDQVESGQRSGDVAADSDSVAALVRGHARRLPGLLILGGVMAAPWWSSTVMETAMRWRAELKPGGRKAECSGLLPLYTQKSSQ